MKTLFMVVAIVILITAPVKGQVTPIAPLLPRIETISEVLRKHVSQDLPILPDISVTSPDSSVLKELAELSGAWVGEWRGERTKSYMFEHAYVFEKISNKSVTIVSMSVGRFRTNYGEKWSNRFELPIEIEKNPLTVYLPNGNEVTFQIKDGHLLTRSAHPNGSANIGTFKRVQ